MYDTLLKNTPKAHYTQDKVCYKLKICIVHTINSAYKGIFVFHTDKVSVYTIDMKRISNWISETRTQLEDVTIETGLGLVDWSHARFPPVASKRTSFKRVCLQKKSACLWRMHDLNSSCSSDKVKWGLRSCSSEQRWSLLHASTFTGSSISRDIASKRLLVPGHPLTVGQGARRPRARSSLTEPDISNSSQKKPC